MLFPEEGKKNNTTQFVVVLFLFFSFYPQLKFHSQSAKSHYSSLCTEMALKGSLCLFIHSWKISLLISNVKQFSLTCISDKAPQLLFFNHWHEKSFSYPVKCSNSHEITYFLGYLCSTQKKTTCNVFAESTVSFFDLWSSERFSAFGFHLFPTFVTELVNLVQMTFSKKFWCLE